jgi:hypothetical protein
MCSPVLMARQRSHCGVICCNVFSSRVELLHNSSSHCWRDQLIKLLPTIPLTRRHPPCPSLAVQKHSSQWFCNPGPLYSVFFFLMNAYELVYLAQLLTFVKRKFHGNSHKKYKHFMWSRWQNAACWLLLLVSCLAYISVMKMETLYSSERSVALQATYCYNPEGSTRHWAANPNKSTIFQLLQCNVLSWEDDCRWGLDWWINLLNSYRS